MNEQQKQTTTKIGLLFIVLLVGVLIGTKLTKEPKEVVVTVEVEENRENWEKLKQVDDEAFKIASKQLELCTGAMYAASNGDMGTLTAIEAEVKKESGKSGAIVKTRQEVLKDLGY